MIEEDLMKLQEMDLKELKSLFLRYFNEHPPMANKEYYVVTIGYRMQELEFGGLSVASKNLLAQIATQKAPVKQKTIAPVGTTFVKTYKGNEYVVRVLERGFNLNGKHFKSLSGIARQITGMKISGKLFFGLE